eukprot:CAMPEP_0183321654 /NCGR_PEP_ID=MMETSP0160_2-20130417/69434_1 /TAXON_ID=2839 ORGANISM="Odontella Sinensis, Strain Grunow 1884" /NCGR_SAMPLE_ID=MMETSP0160_2 /ASSEMBLY_ACC=CAM_ASM_000250 /LENGTH=139 /DNA_ID=CAMNT_0025488637 /DNA_START=73 /DNA_END=491 /DNA_ORIENTATION=+
MAGEEAAVAVSRSRGAPGAGTARDVTAGNDGAAMDAAKEGYGGALGRYGRRAGNGRDEERGREGRPEGPDGQGRRGHFCSGASGRSARAAPGTGRPELVAGAVDCAALAVTMAEGARCGRALTRQNGGRSGAFHDRGRR